MKWGSMLLTALVVEGLVMGAVFIIAVASKSAKPLNDIPEYLVKHPLWTWVPAFLGAAWIFLVAAHSQHRKLENALKLSEKEQNAYGKILNNRVPLLVIKRATLSCTFDPEESDPITYEWKIEVNISVTPRNQYPITVPDDNISCWLKHRSENGGPGGAAQLNLRESRRVPKEPEPDKWRLYFDKYAEMRIVADRRVHGISAFENSEGDFLEKLNLLIIISVPEIEDRYFESTIELLLCEGATWKTVPGSIKMDEKLVAIPQDFSAITGDHPPA